MKEIWKDIKEFEGIYKVSNLGRIKSLVRGGTNGGIITFKERHRYLRARLWKNGVVKTIGVHRLVAQAFIPNPNKLVEINHIDGNKLNNVATNLEWVTHSENMIHAYNNGFRKTKKVMQLKNGMLIKTFLNINRASLETGIEYASIYWCANGVYKTAGGFEWRYAV